MTMKVHTIWSKCFAMTLLVDDLLEFKACKGQLALLLALEYPDGKKEWEYSNCQHLQIRLARNVWRVRVQVELGPNNNYNLLSSDLCDVRSKTESFYKVY